MSDIDARKKLEIRQESGQSEQKGHLHPLTQTIEEIRSIFSQIGFEVAMGPEIETEFYNFDALNVPGDHPARDMQDTFWLKSGARLPTGAKLPKDNSGASLLLRTHTSPVQIHYMEDHMKAGQLPPYRIIVPGKVFRNEATDATHEAQFYQLEGLMVDKEVSMANLKGVLIYFFKKFFGEDVSLRFRPSFFPFTEPSAEVDISCFKCHGKEAKQACKVCKGTGWIEVMGAGLVHPNVLKAAGVDPTEWKGFAFGGGIDRLIMLKYGVEDVRLFYSGDLRLINQF